VRRTVATLLVVASPLLLATPVSGAVDARLPSSGGSTPTVASGAPVIPDVKAPVTAGAPSGPSGPSGPTSPAGPTGTALKAVPLRSTPAALTPPAAPAPVRHALKPARTRARPAPAAGIGDSAYTAKLHAELCAARQIFCGLATNGRYPTR
jgi:hypothetical protein